MNDRNTNMLKERLARFVRLMEMSAPDAILENAAACIVDSFTLLYPGVWAEFGRSLQKTMRNRAGLCCECGETEIPALLTHPIECKVCDDAWCADAAKHGVDPHEPNPPDIEEILVDLQNDESQKINNLSDEYLDALERAMESRVTQEERE